MPWWGRRKKDAEIDRELRAHLDLEAEDQRKSGLSEDNARYAAQRALGNATLIQEDTRAVWRWTWLEQLGQDLRYAIRGIWKNPGFSVTATVSLALGIGAATAVFSVLNAVALRPLPVAEPDRLVVLRPELRGKRFVLFNPLFEELRDSQQSLSGMFAVSDEPYLKAAFNSASPSFVRGSLVSGNYFQVLGLSPAFGRLFTAEDDEPSVESCAAVVSHSFWQRTLKGDSAILGQPVVVREKHCTIVGVAPAGYRSHEAGYAPDLWVPLRPLTDPNLLASRGMAFYSGVIGRLRPEVTIAQAETELNEIYQRLQPAAQPSPHPGETPITRGDFRMRVLPGEQGLDQVRVRLGQPLVLAFAVVGVVLLIAAVNVANLLLARGAARHTELATRAALGAGRARLMRLLAFEGAALSVGGGLLGVGLAFLAAPALPGVLPLPATVSLDAAPDIRVAAIAVAATLFASLLTGLLPAWRLSRQDLHSAVAGGERATAARSRQRLTRTLVAAQLALSLLLVTTAGLLLRTMVRVMAVDPGFGTSHVLLMDIKDTEPAAKFGEVDTSEAKERRAVRYRTLDERMNAIPGVQAASLSWLGLFSSSYVGLNVYDADQPASGRFTLVDYTSPRYFEAVGMRLLRGRGFTADDREGSLRVAVVNEAYVRERLPAGLEAIGRRLVMTYADDRRPWSIVGIVRDSKYNDLRKSASEPMIWVPLSQAPFKFTSVSLRVHPGAEAAVTREARIALAATSPHLMVRKTTTLRDQVDQTTARERLSLSLSSSFGGIALLLAAVGLYGTLAYAVARRTREIGVRLALGARPGSVLRLVVGESFKLLLAGMLSGVPLALAAGYVMRGFLFGVTPYDLSTLIGAGVLLSVVALLAALAPARRAARVDPIVALRYE